MAFAFFGLPSEPHLVGLATGFGVGMTFAAGAFSFLPALLAIVLAEAFGWRSIFYWLAVGGDIGLAARGFTDFGASPEWADYALIVPLGAGFGPRRTGLLADRRTAGRGRRAARRPARVAPRAPTSVIWNSIKKRCRFLSSERYRGPSSRRSHRIW